MTKERKPRKHVPPHSERGKKLRARESSEKKAARLKRQHDKQAAEIRAPYSPTDQERLFVQIGTAAGIGRAYLRGIMNGGKGISAIQFDEAFATEVEIGTDAVNFKVVSNLFKIAASNTKDRVTLDAIKFWLERKAGWTAPSAAQSATVKVAPGSAAPVTGGPVDPTRIIEVSFKIGDDSKIKDEG